MAKSKKVNNLNLQNNEEKELQNASECIRNFVSDLQCLNPLKRWTKNINIFQILKIDAYETRHTNILAWLLNSNENHGLGDAFVKEFIKSAISKNKRFNNDILDWMFINFNNQKVDINWRCEDDKTKAEKEGLLDILIRFEDEKYLIAIENKTTSQEHKVKSSGKYQTEHYKYLIDSKYTEYKKIYIFLSPQGDEPKDLGWGILTYEDIVSAIDNTTNNTQLLPEVKMIVTNYCQIIKKHLISDEELIEECDNIYKKHQMAIDIMYKYKDKEFPNNKIMETINKIHNEYQKEMELIYENKLDEVAKISDKLRQLLKDKSKEENSDINYEKSGGKGYIRFTTKTLDEKIAKPIEGSGSWGTNSSYYFWFGLQRVNNKCKILFRSELGGWNLDEDTQQVHKKIWSEFATNKTDDSYRYRRIFKGFTKIIDLEQEDIDTKLLEIFNKGMQEYQKNQAKILELLNS